jgi:hypothetical protein
VGCGAAGVAVAARAGANDDGAAPEPAALPDRGAGTRGWGCKGFTATGAAGSVGASAVGAQHAAPITSATKAPRSGRRQRGAVCRACNARRSRKRISGPPIPGADYVVPTMTSEALWLLLNLGMSSCVAVRTAAPAAVCSCERTWSGC